jgi:hypothetical protein
VLGRDPTVGRALVERLVDKLRAAHLRPGQMDVNDTVRSVELAPLPSTSARLTQVALAPAKQQRAARGEAFDPAQLAEMRLRGSARRDGDLQQDVWCGAAGRSLINVEYDQLGQSLLPKYLGEALALTSQRPADGVLAAATTEAHHIVTGLSCKPLPSGATNLTFELVTKLELDDQAVANEWWSQRGWSSKDAWKMPERVYGLEAIILPILQDRAKQTTRWDGLVLHVTRE